MGSIGCLPFFASQKFLYGCFYLIVMNTGNNEKIVPPFSIWSQKYEQAADSKFNVELASLKNGEETDFQGDLENNLPFRGFSDTSRIEKLILHKYDSVPGFCSMLLKDKEELFEHIQQIYETSYMHYVWAKETNMNGKFPYGSCANSSSNLFLSLLSNGYPNTSLLSNFDFSHSYVGLPFVLEKDSSSGFVIVDPTSDQLFREKRPRNNIFVSDGNKWDYFTDWKCGENLYPSSKTGSDFYNLHTLRKRPGLKNINKFYRKVFENPVDISNLPEKYNIKDYFSSLKSRLYGFFERG